MPRSIPQLAGAVKTGEPRRSSKAKGQRSRDATKEQASTSTNHFTKAASFSAGMMVRCA
jgi:hypothetical protein